MRLTPIERTRLGAALSAKIFEPRPTRPLWIAS